MRMTKKIFAIALSIFMVVSMMPFTVFAQGLPVADVEEINIAGYETAYSFKTTDTAETVDASAYKDYVTDFVVSFDHSIEAGQIVLGGSYEGYNNGEWVEIALPALAAGETYRLLADSLGETFTYEDIVKIVKEFKCAAKGLDAAGVTLNLDLNLYETAASTTPITVAEKEYTFTGLPVAIVSDITVDGYEKAYSFKANDTAESIATNSYKDYITDFVISFDKDVAAGAVVLGGSYEGYNNGEWVEIALPALSAGEPYRLLAENLGETFTYEDIVTIVKEFKCAAKGLDAAGATISVDLNLYETATSTTPITIADEEYTFSAVPTATVTDIVVDGYEKAYSYKADDTAESIAGNTYKDYIADFVVSVDRDVEAGQIVLAGSYEGYNNGEWVEITLPALTAGTPYRLLAENLGETFTYEDIVTIVKEFKCAAKGLNAAGVTLSVDLNLYETAASTAPITIADKEYTFEDAVSAVPTATVTDIFVDGYEKAYCYTADDTAESIAGNSYKDYLADFVVSVDRDVAAGQIILAGSYEGYNNGEWVEIALPALTAGTPYRLLAENLGESFTYEDIVTIVKEFKCAAKGLDAAGVTLSVDLNIYEAAASAPIAIAEKEYTFANDEFSITVADEIDLNIYVEDTGNIVALEVTNFDLETEDTTHGTVTYSGSELAALLSGNQYKVRVPLAPAQIRDSIQVKVITSDGNTGDGSVGRVITKSVADYCDDILASGMDQIIKDLAQSVLDYGKAASDYFDYNTDLFDGYAIANPTATFGTYNASESSIGISKVEYRATSVPEMRFCVTGVDEETAAGMSISSNIGEASFAKLPDGTIILQVVGIPASKLGQEIVISGDVSLKYTPLKWAKAASTNSIPELAAFANAVANYSAAANAYFG